jgi:hypothetical protein
LEEALDLSSDRILNDCLAAPLNQPITSALSSKYASSTESLGDIAEKNFRSVVNEKKYTL